MLRTVSIGSKKISYNLTYKNVKNFNLRVKSDGSVCVSAPICIGADKIDEFVAEKSKFILTNIEKFEKMQAFKPAPKRYVSGESFAFLGSNLRLKVVPSSKDEIFSDGIHLFLKVRDIKDFSKKKRLVDKWLKEQTLTVYNQVADDVYKDFVKHGITRPSIRIREMSTRWGSCQYRKGIITLNTRLIESPRICIEYVMMHEFCHFIHPNHSKNFYSLLQTMMPDWKERKKILESSIFCYQHMDE